jgi:AsmA protein
VPERPKHRRPWLLGGLVSLATAVGVVVIAAVIFVATFNANSYKPRIVNAVQVATGRTLALNGPIGLKFSLHPTIEVGDAVLGNPPGFSRPDMARVRAIDVQLDLPSLVHRQIVIQRLVLVDPDVLLERTAQGEVNWRFAPTGTQTAVPPPAGAAPPAEARRLELGVSDVQIENGRFAYRDNRTGHVAAVDIRRLRALAPLGGPMHLTADAAVNGLAFTANADTGSLDALQAPPGGASWPVKLTLEAAGATIHATGTMARPLEGSGYQLVLDGAIPDLAALAPFAPKAKLPPLRQVAFAAQVADSGGPIPYVSALSLRAGASDLSSVLAGLKVEKLDVAAPGLEQPVHADLTGNYGGAQLTLAASLGAPAKLLTGQPAGPFPVDVTATAAGASVAVKGGIADPAHLTGLDLNTSAQIPDLGALSPLVQRPLPPLRNVAFQGHLISPNGLRNGIELQGAKLTSALADLAGDAGVNFSRPPWVTARLTSDRLDLDAVLAAFRQPAPAAPPPPAHPAPAKPPIHAAGHVIPDTKLPFDQLHDVNADVQLTAAALTSGGETWRDVSGHLVLQDGKLHLAPFKATLPAGTFDLALSIDAIQPRPPVAVQLKAPSVALASLLALAGQPAFAKGSVAITADVHGTGDTPHEIAASLNGTMAASMAGGEIETRVLEQALGPVIARANPIGMLSQGGASEIHCFTARLDARDGVATLNPLALSSSLISLSGGGTLNLGTETLDLHLQSQGRIGGTGIAVPLTVTGGFRDPHVVLNQTGAAEKGFEVVIGALTGKNNPLAGLAGSAPACGLAAGEAHSGGAPAPAAPRTKLPNAGAVLRQLFR